MTTSTGDLFKVSLQNYKKGYFQFIMLDSTQMNSEVIRVFRTHYSSDEEPSLSKVVDDDVQFYAHVMIKVGVNLDLWEKVGNHKLESDMKAPFFRGSNDYGNPEVKVSKSWYVWKANEEFVQVGELKEEHTGYDIGSVLAAPEIPEIMKTGKSSFFYPAYQ